jgi:hypothetical protein
VPLARSGPPGDHRICRQASTSVSAPVES